MSTCVCVLSNNGERLMPTIRLGKVRRLLKDGKAKVRSNFQSSSYLPCGSMDTNHLNVDLNNLYTKYNSVRHPYSHWSASDVTLRSLPASTKHETY